MRSSVHSAVSGYSLRNSQCGVREPLLDRGQFCLFPGEFADGRSVERIAKGRYRLATSTAGAAAAAETELFSDDPHAV